MDGVSHETYTLSVTIKVSDNRRRDLDGALATVCDVAVAVGRQLQSDYANSSEGGESPER